MGGFVGQISSVPADSGFQSGHGRQSLCPTPFEARGSNARGFCQEQGNYQEEDTNKVEEEKMCFAFV